MRPSQDAILGAVARLQRRAALVTFVRVGVRALFYSLLVGAALTPLVPEAMIFPGLAFLASLAVVGAAVATVALQDSDVAVAKRYDDHAGTQDRLATSLQLLSEEGPMAQALLEDTAALTPRIDPRGVYPVRLPREGWLLPLPVLVVLGVLFLPTVVAQADPTQQVVDQALEDQAARISEFVARERSKLSSTGRRKVLAKLEDLSAELTRKKLGKQEAMSKLAKLMDELAEEDAKEEEERLRLRRMMKNFQTNEKNKDLADQLDKGNYQDAANRIKKLLEELRKKLDKKKAKKKKTQVDLEELEKLREEIKKLEDVQAKLLRLMNLQNDMNMRGEVLDFLKDVEGDLADLPEDEVEDRRFVRLGELNPNQNPNQQGKIQRIKRRMLLPPNKEAGSGTMEEFQGEAKRSEHEREEKKVKVRESKGQSSFSQVQVADDGSRSAVEAKEIYQAERRAAEDTMQRQEVPAGYREYLRRYFDGMQPDEREKK